jgi:response regulator RpfG family c-di-GMP phosphodiesterase
MKNYPTILIVTQNKDTQSILSAYVSELMPYSSLIISESADNIKKTIGENSSFIIFSDEKIGNKSAYDLYNNILEYSLSKNLYQICITSKKEYLQLKKIIEFGFNDYLTNINDKAIVLNRLRIAFREIQRREQIAQEQAELKDLSSKLASELQGFKSLSLKLIEKIIPSASEMLASISSTSTLIYKELGKPSDDEIFNIELAVNYSQIGRLFLPKELALLPIMHKGNLLNPEMQIVPQMGREILESIEEFKKVADIVYHIWENFDGTGIPSRIQKWQIPIESRILRAVIDFEENKFFHDLSSSESINILKANSNRIYDPKVIGLLQQITQKIPERELQYIALHLADLQEGMVLGKDIISSTGHKLIGAETKLSAKTIDILKKHSQSDPIFGYIYVDKNYFHDKLS